MSKQNQSQSMKKVEAVFGIDFGTSKTVISRCMEGGPNPVDTIIRVQSKTRIPTCLLRLETEMLIGQVALDVHQSSSEEEMNQGVYEFTDNFKAALPIGGAARKDCEDFWNTLAKDEDVAAELKRYGNHAITVIGRPASWNQAAADDLCRIAASAGFPNPKCKPEPVGALFSFMARHLREEHLRRHIMVIDFGAGTLDFTLMTDGDLGSGEHWGSNLYGGQIFDDLFFEWFMEQAKAKAEHDDRLQDQIDQVLGNASRGVLPDLQLQREFRTQQARLLKEEFSNWMANTKGRRFSPRNSTFEHEGLEIRLGKLSCENPDDFYTRARCYRPSPFMLKTILSKANLAVEGDRPYLRKLERNEPVDLIQWGEDLIRAAVAKLPGTNNDRLCILTGGGTRWVWVKAILDKLGAFEVDFVLQDNEPELTIGTGLGRAYMIGQYAEQQLQALLPVQGQVAERLQEEFLHERVKQLCDNTFKNVFDESVKKKVTDIWTEFGEFELQVWKNGSASQDANQSLIDLRAKATEQTKTVVKKAVSSPRFQAMLKAEVMKLELDAEKHLLQIMTSAGIRTDGLLRSALGATRLPDHEMLASSVLKRLEEIHFEPGLFEEIWSYLQKIIGIQTSQGIASGYTQRACERTLETVEQSIEGVLDATAWSNKVVASIEASLARIASLAADTDLEELKQRLAA